MFYTTGRFVAMAGVCVLCWATPASAQPVPLTVTYSQNFDSMGAAGITPPPGWTVYSIAGDSSTWTNTAGSNSVPPSPGIAAGAVAGGTASTGLTARLIDPSNVAGNNVNGYNAATGANPDDRTLATAPTGVAGSVLELQLTNNTGAAQTSLLISYQIRVLQVGAPSGTRTPPSGIPPGSDEIPGYWLFVSRDGTNYINASQLNPVGEGSPPQVVVPNALGVTTVPPTVVDLGGTWDINTTLFLRWVDDNAFDPSPDPIYGLDTVLVAPVPEPSAVLAVSAAGLLACWRAVRRRTGARGSPTAA
jgi:hypothetical protein